MQTSDTSLHNTKEKLELYLLQLKTNAVAIEQEFKRLAIAVNKEIEFLERLIQEIP